MKPNQSAPAGSSPHAAGGPSARSRGQDAAVVALTGATVLAGVLSPMQSAVNGQLGKTIGDGNAAALISFGTGLVLMAIIVFSRAATRREALAIPHLIRTRQIPWWNFLAGLCGAVIVLSEGTTVGVLGVATFQIALISGLVISGVVCDRLGVTTGTKQAVTATRALGALLAIVATVIVISPSFSVPHTIVLAVMPFVGGLLAGWQPAGNAAVADATGSMLVSIGWNFLVGFVALLIAYLVRAATTGVDFQLPHQWWLFLGGPLGLASIALMALLVRGLGLLLLGLASTAGQLLGSLALDAVIPALGQPVYVATVVGTLVALAAAAIGMIPSRKVADGQGAAGAVPGSTSKAPPRLAADDGATAAGKPAGNDAGPRAMEGADR